jgi:hypothetical protein
VKTVRMEDRSRKDIKGAELGDLLGRMLHREVAA